MLVNTCFKSCCNSKQIPLIWSIIRLNSSHIAAVCVGANVSLPAALCKWFRLIHFSKITPVSSQFNYSGWNLQPGPEMGPNEPQHIDLQLPLMTVKDAVLWGVESLYLCWYLKEIEPNKQMEARVENEDWRRLTVCVLSLYEIQANNHNRKCVESNKCFSVHILFGKGTVVR